jgi:hypothetical protein
MPVISESFVYSPPGRRRDRSAASSSKPQRTSRLRLFLPLLFAALLVIDAEAARPRRRTARPKARPAPRYRFPAATPPRPPAAAEPKEKLQEFRDLPIGVQFHLAADRDRRLFPLKKISPTQARAVGTDGTASAAPVAIPGEMKVLVKQPVSTQAATKKTRQAR